jgi:hypothetical protein
VVLLLAPLPDDGDKLAPPKPGIPGKRFNELLDDMLLSQLIYLDKVIAQSLINVT